MDFIEFLNGSLAKYYNKISARNDTINVDYQSSLGEEEYLSDRSRIMDRFDKKLNLIFRYEVERKKSIIGPHLDDVQFFKENKVFRDYSSQGENKTLVIALKFLEWKYITIERSIKPLLLMDDIK